MSIQQGNYLVTDSVSQLKEGMTRSQVRFLLGTPMVPDAFDDSRWDYYYFFSSRNLPAAAEAPPDGLLPGRDECSASKTRAFRRRRISKQLEQDLQKAIAATKKNEPKHTAIWQRMTGHGTSATGCRRNARDATDAQSRSRRAARAAGSRAAFPAFTRARRDSFGSALSGR